MTYFLTLASPLPPSFLPFLSPTPSFPLFSPALTRLPPFPFSPLSLQSGSADSSPSPGNDHPGCLCPPLVLTQDTLTECSLRPGPRPPSAWISAFNSGRQDYGSTLGTGIW